MVAEGAPLPRSIRIGLLLSVSLVVLSLAGVLAIRTAMRQLALPVFGEVPDFALVDQEGQPFIRADLDGLIHLVAFIYTSCPDICPATSARMAAFQAELARAGLTDKVHLLSITVDPEYDTPEQLAAYARRFGADTASWRFLTGRPDHVRTVVEKGFLVGIQQLETDQVIHAGHHHGDAHAHGGAPATDYRVEHSGRVALVDPEGRILAFHQGNFLDTDEVMAQIRLLLSGR